MSTTQHPGRQEMNVAKYQMSNALVDKIMLCATIIAAISGIAEYVAQIFPISMFVDSVAAIFMALLLVLRSRIGTQIKLSLMILTGLVIALTAISQNPYAPDGYMVLGGVVAMAFANWPLKRAMLIPSLAILALAAITLLVKFKLIVIAPFSAEAQNSPSAWLIIVMCMGLLSVAVGGAILELKSRLMRHIGLLEGANERLENYAFNDEGTGLGNERYLEQKIDIDLAGGSTGCLLVINLVGVELYHALHGHKDRDALLNWVAFALREGMQKNHILAKLDGALFAVWARDFEDSDQLYRLVKDCIEASIPLVQFGIVPGAAAVVAPLHGNAYRELMKNILVVMSMMPAAGMDGCLHFSAEMERKIMARQALKQKIRHALDNDGFYPVYQAKVGSGSHLIEGFEGLARMRADAMDPAPGPAVFIPVLHEEGWMTEFGMIMLRHIIGDIPALVARFGPATKVAANVSPPLFLSTVFVSEVKNLLEKFAVDPSHLIIEITEEVFTIDVEKIRKVCRELQQLGIQISLDDFGSGFSSLSFLRSMNFDEIKIDRSFISRIDEDEKSYLLLSSICKLGQDLQCRVVVEGVETTAQLTLVEQTPCAQIQGFLFAMPLALATILAHEQAC